MTPWYLLAFSPRERWFHRHRACEVSKISRRGFDMFTCENWHKSWRHRSKSWTDNFPFA